MFRRLFLLLILCLFWAPEIFANPQISSISGTFFNGGSVTINGISFGTKSLAAPVIWDDCETGTVDDNWDVKYPSACADTDYNMHYDTTAGLGRGVAQAHNHSTKYAVGGHHPGGYDPFHAYKGPNVLVAKSVTASSYTYMSYYYRGDPDWPDTTGNYKIGRFCKDSVLSGVGGESSPTGFYFSYDGHPPPFHWHTNFTSPYFFSDVSANNPKDGWIKIEIIVHHTNDSNGWFRIYEDGTEITKNGTYWTGNPSSLYWNRIVFGGFREGGDLNAFRYFDDLYFDNTRARVIIGNNVFLANSTVREIQIPEAWSENEITVTVNWGSFAVGETAYLFIVDADGNVNTQGYPITVTLSGFGPPSPPTSPHITSTNISGSDLDVTLEWYANTEPDIDHYIVYWGTSSGTYPADSGTIDKSTTTYTIQDLDKDQIHFIAVKAFDDEVPELQSAYSNEIDTKAPQITSPPTVTSIADTTVVIEWQTDVLSNSLVEYRKSEADPPDLEESLPDYVTNHSITLTGLDDNTLYRFRVSSTDVGGAGPGISDTDNNPSSPYNFFTTKPTPDTTAPQITSPPTVTSITNTTAVIEWQTDEPSTSLVQYDDNSSTWGNYLWSKTDTSLVTTHSVTLTWLTADTKYYFRVGSTDGSGNGPTTSNEVTFTTETTADTTAPQITTPPTVTGITKTTAVIEWQTDEPSNSLVDYGLTTSYGSQATLADYVTNHSVTLTGLTEDTDYHFRVGSTDAAGNGPTYSNNNTFTTETADDRAPEIISPPTVTSITDSTAVIEWETDEPSNSMVRYDTQTRPAWADYLSSENDAGMVTSHSVTLTGLNANQTYYFMVGSADAFGNGPDTSATDNNPSVQQYFTTELTPDTDAPLISSVKVAGTSNTTAIITWTTDEPSNSMVQYGDSSTWGNYDWSENDAGMVTSHTVTITGLTGGSTYYFRVGSNDASGNGPDLNSNSTNPSAQQDFTTELASDTDAPVISSVPPPSTTDTTAIITWTTDEPSNSMVRYDTISRSAWGDYLLREDDAEMVTSHSVTLTGLEALTPYYFRVGSTDASGNGPYKNQDPTNPSDEYSFTTTVPDTEAPEIYPLTIKGEEITDTTATIKWDTNELSNSMVQYGTISSIWGNYTWSKNNAQMVTSHSVTLTGLTKGTPYHFRVGSTDASGNGPPLKVNTSNPSDDITFDTTNTDIDPPSIIGVHIDYVNDRIDITYDEANMRNANIEDNYKFTNPTLSFRTALPLPNDDDITYRGSNMYSLFMSFIPENTGFTLTVTGITDQAGNEVDPDSITIGIPPAAGDIREVIPHNKAGIDDDTTRIPHNTSFAVRIEDSDEIDTTHPENIKFTINDGFLPTIYDYNLGNQNVVRVVQLDPNETKDKLTKLWVVYDRSTDYTYGPEFEFGRTVTISVDVKDKKENSMNGTYSFEVETQEQHNDAEANLPPTGYVGTNDPDLEGSYVYDTGAQIASGQLIGAKILYDNDEPVTPTFGPMNEIPALNISGVDAVGVPMNLQPPTVFNTPVEIFIPCPGYPYVSTLSVYRYSGTSWVLACDHNGTVQPGGEGWMVPGSRVNHNSANGSTATIEIQVYHFSGVQAGSPSGSVGRSTSEVAGGGCFIATAAYGSNMDKHVKILSEFRDRRLLNNPIGRGILDAYDKFSPSVANYLNKHPFARAVVRYALIPITGMAYISLSIHPLALLFAFVLLLLIGVYCFKQLAIRD